MPKLSIPQVVKSCIDNRWLVVAVYLVVFLASLHYAASHFAITTDTSQMVSANVRWRQLETRFDKAFPARVGLTLVVIDGPTPELAEQAAGDLEERLQRQTIVLRQVRRPDAGAFFERNGLLFLSPEELARQVNQLLNAQPFLGSLAADPSLRGLMHTMSLMAMGVREKETTFEAIALPVQAFASIFEALNSGKAKAFSWRELISGTPARPEQLRRLILTQPVLDYSDLEPGHAAAEAIRAAARDLRLTPETGYRVRLTGPVPLADEEFATVADGAGLNGAITVLVVLLILKLALRSAKIIAAVFLCLFIGLAMTAALGLMLVPTLNLISVAFAVLFVGLGVDFGLQFSVRYREERHISRQSQAALLAAAQKAGTPLALAAASTTAAFYAFLPTDYRGISELGLIAGTGMMVALLTSLTLLPALLSLFRTPDEPVAMGYRFLAPLDAFLARHRYGVLALTAAVSLAGLPLLAKVRFDFNPLNLRSARTESVATYLDLMRDPATNPNTIDIASPSPAAAAALAARLEALPEVGQAITLSSFVPSGQEAKLEQIQDLATLLSPTLYPAAVMAAPSDNELVASMGEAAEALAGAAQNGSGEGVTQARRLALALRQMAAGPPANRAMAASLLLPGFARVLAQTRQALQAETVTLETLPPEIVADWTASDGQARIEVFARGDTDDNAVVQKFVAAVRAVAPDATGAPVSILESGNTIVHAFWLAGLWALVSISALLYLVLRRVGDVLLTLVPLLLAGVVTLEICALTGMPLNFANIIALPLLLGIGVAFKIYFILAWRAGETNLLQSSLTRAVFFSAMTTATAFGSLLFSKHPGTSSMGKLLALSLVTTLVAAVLFQPALMGPPREKGGD